MKIVLKTKDEQLTLKNYSSYLELDKFLSTFSSKEELINSLDLEESGEVLVLDNNGKELDYDPNILRATLSYYNKGAGYKFVKWIYDCSGDPEYSEKNKNKLQEFFISRMYDFIKEQDEDEFDINSIKNQEGKRLFELIKNIKDNLSVFKESDYLFGKDEEHPLVKFEFAILPDIDSYIKKGNYYDYAYMRKFISSLVSDFGYELKKPEIELINRDEQLRDKTIKEFNTTIHNYFYPKKQVTLDDVVNLEEEVTPKYDENGIKIDEKEFLEEFNKKKLSL